GFSTAGRKSALTTLTDGLAVAVAAFFATVAVTGPAPLIADSCSVACCGSCLSMKSTSTIVTLLLGTGSTVPGMVVDAVKVRLQRTGALLLTVVRFAMPVASTLTFTVAAFDLPPAKVTVLSGAGVDGSKSGVLTLTPAGQLEAAAS